MPADTPTQIDDDDYPEGASIEEVFGVIRSRVFVGSTALIILSVRGRRPVW